MRALALASILVVFPAGAFEALSSGKSYPDIRYLEVGLGAGALGFARQENIDGNLGFSIRLSAAHPLNRYVQIQFNYQFSHFDFASPDPLDTSSNIRTDASMNQESIVARFLYPRFAIQPYLSAGLGGYSWSGVDRETTLSFPMNLFVPLSAGLRTYFVKNLISFDAEFSYHLLFGENQSADTLALINRDRVSFDTYGITGTFQFHLF